ncbi:shikimate dehydrogenase family protein [Candidatus Karelsulcia muelleri]|uniref:shikimate dehydrogenase family protein n=1 Tax=Candidatus Karelsulcia muelleri TaxID=336810 RepID=UPI000B92C1CC|nr:shikimate dehydrogenase [Candidatus Karelsulcia muelleri]ASS46932.1 Shikimate dehydrogenase [Candidatus Karelsulcia muelleri]
MIQIYGLVGKNISYSFSQFFFLKKFNIKNIKNTFYTIFDIKLIRLINLFIDIKKKIKGLNITIPYKKKIINYIDLININLIKLESINTVKILSKITIGYNTDIYGFENSFKFKRKSYINNALLLGNGGVSQSIIFVLNKLGIKYIVASRNQYTKYCIFYSDISINIINNYNTIINCTPLGTYPNLNICPNIPYMKISNQYYLYDLVYNPKETLFLKIGKKKGSIINNGINMLYLQANISCKIWYKIFYSSIYERILHI